MNEERRTATKAHLVGYLEFCEENGIVKPIKVLAEAIRKSYPNGLTAQELTEHLLTDQAEADIRAVISKCVPGIEAEALDEFCRTAWGFNATQLFNTRYRPTDLGTLSEFQGMVKKEKAKIHKWTKKAASAAIAKQLKTLASDELANVFPFRFQSVGERNYESFCQSRKSKVQLPSVGAIFGNGRIYQNIFELNADVARKLGIEYEIPTKRSIIQKVSSWLEGKNRSNSSLLLKEVDDLIAECVVDPVWIHHRGGVFKSKRGFVQAVRESDGRQRLKIGFDLSDLSRDQILEIISENMPRIECGRCNTPPRADDIDAYAADKILPYSSTFIGKGKKFESMRDLHIALGYPRIRIPHKYQGKRNAPLNRRNVNLEIIKVMDAMYAAGMEPGGAIGFTRADFDRAQELGIVDHAARIIGREGWYATDGKFEKTFINSFQTDFSRNLDDEGLGYEDTEMIEFEAFDALLTRVRQSPLRGIDQVNEEQIATWAIEGICPTIKDMEVIFGSWFAVKATIRLIEKSDVAARAQSGRVLAGALS